MAHTKNYLVIFSFLFLLAACNHRKEKQNSSNDEVYLPAINTVTADYNEAVNITALNKAYTSSITETFIVKQKKVTLLTGKRGLKITVNPAALETEDGNAVDGDIKVEMIELTTSEDLFKSNAATMSNGRLLSSGGSYFIGMECNGKKLQLKNNRTIQMEFPKMKEEEMELFYGDKDEEGNINWNRADEPLTFNNRAGNVAVTAVYRPPYPGNDERKRFKSRFKLYKTLTDQVYYQKNLMTIEQMAHVLHNNGVDKNIDTLQIPLYEFYYGLSYNPKFKYDTVKRYRIVSCKDIEADIDSMAKEKKITEEREEANRKYNEEWWKTNDDGTLEGKLQRYYAASSVTKLGWINCDRFYQYPQNIETPVEIPYTFSNPDIQYFLIYKSINGLTGGKLVKNEKQQYVLYNLPRGEKVTMVAFTKQDGKIYNYKEEFVIKPNQTIKPEFKIISAEEMNKMFGANVII